MTGRLPQPIAVAALVAAAVACAPRPASAGCGDHVRALQPGVPSPGQVTPFGNELPDRLPAGECVGGNCRPRGPVLPPAAAADGRVSFASECLATSSAGWSAGNARSTKPVAATPAATRDGDRSRLERPPRGFLSAS